MKNFWVILLVFAGLYSCSVSRQVSRQANELLIKDSAIASGHIGISIYEPAAGKYWYNYNADKNFIPASNVKLFTLYAAMKHLGDSLVGARYTKISNATIGILPTGDPTFLHPQFQYQPLLEFFQHNNRSDINLENGLWKSTAYGKGWMWDDYDDISMVERSPLPIYGNYVDIKVDSIKYDKAYSTVFWNVSPTYFSDKVDEHFDMREFFKIRLSDSMEAIKNIRKFKLSRHLKENYFKLSPFTKEFTSIKIPFYTKELETALDILRKEYHQKININSFFKWPETSGNEPYVYQMIHSQPTDSLLKPMMHRSDNFFAEQTLLMVSNETFGYMSDEDMIDNLLRTDFKNLPQKPRWVDGSGLSRYNLASPDDFVYLLNKIKNEFSWQRITNILPTGGEGTLANYFKDAAGFIYAKTGTLSNNSALSGYLITKKNKLLIFSVLNNNYAGGATPVRRAVEKFLLQLREKY